MQNTQATNEDREEQSSPQEREVATEGQNRDSAGSKEFEAAPLNSKGRVDPDKFHSMLHLDEQGRFWMEFLGYFYTIVPVSGVFGYTMRASMDKDAPLTTSEGEVFFAPGAAETRARQAILDYANELAIKKELERKPDLGGW